MKYCPECDVGRLFTVISDDCDDYYQCNCCKHKILIPFYPWDEEGSDWFDFY